MEKSKIICLNWNNICVAKLLRFKKHYFFQIIPRNIELAKKENCPVDFLFYKNSIKYVSIHNQIPFVFNQFKINDSRSDLLKKYNIKENDSDFEKLCKVAQVKEKSINDFWISLYTKNINNSTEH